MYPNRSMQHTIEIFRTMILHNQLVHAHVFYFQNDPAAAIATGLKELARMILCHQKQNDKKDSNYQHSLNANLEQIPCDQCPSCQLFAHGEHPDCMLIAPEKRGAAVKIDAIRACQETVYISSQMGHGRVVIIEAVEKMNIASANAFLKLLEEPPPQVYFLLQTAQLGGLLPTLLSRCHIWKVRPNNLPDNGLPNFLNALQADEDVARLIAFLPQLCEDILQLTMLKKHWSFVAAKWVDFGVFDLSLALYWITAVCIKLKCGASVHYRSDLPLSNIAQNVTISALFNQLEYLTSVLQLTKQGIAVNPALAIEAYLLRK